MNKKLNTIHMDKITVGHATPLKTNVFDSVVEGAVEEYLLGRKDDNNKNKLEILMVHFVRTLEGVGKCCSYGAVKYNEGLEEKNWSKIDNPKPRYIGALFRHLFEWLKGNKIDPESGLPHIHKAIWNLFVLSEFELQENDNTK